MADTNIGSIIGTAVENLKELAGAETVIGTPIVTANGTTVIPVSKISVGIASGGVDFASKKVETKPSKNFGGGGGTGVNIAPVAFLIVQPDGQVQLLPIGAGGNAPAGGGDKIDKITSFIERSPDIMEKIKSVFMKKKPEQTEADAIATDVVTAIEEAATVADAVAEAITEDSDENK